MSTSIPTLIPDYDPVMALLADAMELIAAAREEYAVRHATDATDDMTDGPAAGASPFEFMRDESAVASVVRRNAS